MRRYTLLPLLAIVLGAGAYSACTSSAADDDGQYVGATPTAVPTATASPTPEATEVPTPDPYVGYRITSMTVEESAGVDLDEDGSVDNNYAEILEDLSGAVADGFVEQCLAILEDVELPDSLPTDNPTLICRSASAAVEQAFAQLVNLESFNTSVAEAMAEPEIIYLLQFTTRGSGLTSLTYYWGEAESTYYYLGDTIGIHSGDIDEFGNAKLGPGEFQLVAKVGGPSVNYIKLVNARTEVNYRVLEGVVNARIGGVLTEEALVALLVDSIAEVAPLPEPILTQIGQAVADLIPECGTSGTVMSDCDDLGGIAMGLTFDTQEAEVY